MKKSIPLSRAPAQAAALLGCCLLALACPGAALAAGKTASTGENAPLTFTTSSGGSHASSGGPSIVRTVVGLAIVLAVIWGLYWVMRQVKAGRDPRAPTDGLTSIAALTIASGRTLHLVRAGSDYLLLGSGEHGLVPIHRYSEEQALEAGLIGVRQIAEPRGVGAGRQPNGASRDPMGGHDASVGPIERLRHWTVRR
jgi:flagellar protein FliO/FliZ